MTPIDELVPQLDSTRLDSIALCSVLLCSALAGRSEISLRREPKKRRGPKRNITTRSHNKEGEAYHSGWEVVYCYPTDPGCVVGDFLASVCLVDFVWFDSIRFDSIRSADSGIQLERESQSL